MNTAMTTTAMLCLALLTGCASLTSVDADFVAAPSEARVIDAPHISWVPTSEMKQICQALGQVAGKGSLGETEHGCAAFNAKLKSCTIFTLPNTSHSVLGHEARHCFEGHFHAQAAIAKEAAPMCKATTEEKTQ